jgi:hypothetical protein
MTLEAFRAIRSRDFIGGELITGGATLARNSESPMKSVLELVLRVEASGDRPSD